MAFLRVRPDERKIVSLSFFLTFLIGACINFMCSIPIAMFLANYESALLPYIYIGVGVVTFLFGSVLTFFEKSVPVGRLWVNAFIGSVIVLLIFWVLLIVTEAKWLSIPLVIWGTALMLTMESCWMILTNQLFTLQQGKRLLGLIASGLAWGGALAGFAIPFLITAIGSNQIILLTALLLSLSVAVQFWMRKHARGRLDKLEEAEEADGTPVSLRSFQNKTYLWLTFAVAAISIFTFYSFDLLFNTELQKHFPSESEMATFYGILYAVYDLSSLLIGPFLFIWLTEKFGIIAALAFTPVSIGLLLSGVFFANLVPASTWIVFPMLTCIAVCENLFRSTVSEEAAGLLYQPLKPAQRAWAQMRGQMYVIPLGVIAAGVFLLLADLVLHLDFFTLTLLLVGQSVLATAVIFAVKKRYIQMLIAAFSKRSIIKPEFSKLDKDAFKDLLAQGEPVVDNVLKNFAHYSVRLQAEAIRLLGLIKDDRAIPFLRENLAHERRKILQAALLALRRHSYKAKKGEIGLVRQLLNKEKDRIMILKVCIEALDPEKELILHDLLLREVELSQRSCFWLLTFIYPEHPIVVAMRGLSIDDEAMVSYATEILMQTLDAQHNKVLLPRLIYKPRTHIHSPELHPLTATLKTVLSLALNAYIPALSSAAIYTAGVLKLTDFADIVKAYENKEDPYLDEIKAEVLRKERGGRGI